jgi:hypothetical protein
VGINESHTASTVFSKLAMICFYNFPLYPNNPSH